jgi:hypothetical protein
MRKLSSLLLTTALLASVAAQPVLADDWRWHGDIHRFHEHDYAHWREGYWHHGFHDGRNGWWWVVGGFWYFYPAPVYPYPDPYTPPGVVVEVVPGAPQAAAPSTYYYCANPAGYYPYVTQCYGAWQAVVSGAAAAAPAPAPVVQPPVAAPAPPPPAAPQAVVPAGSQREADDRQLNAFAAAFDHVDLKDKHARATLRDLEKQVEAFRQSLFQRSYNAMDLLRDSEDLEHRIAKQREKLPKPKKNEQPPPPPATPPPT